MELINYENYTRYDNSNSTHYKDIGRNNNNLKDVGCRAQLEKQN